MTTTDANNGSHIGNEDGGDHGRRHDAVSETVPTALSGNENTAISLSGHSRCRIFRTPTDTLTTTLTVSDGTITVGTLSGVTIVAAATAAAGDAERDGGSRSTLRWRPRRSYTGNSNFYGTDNLSVTTTDTTSGSHIGTDDGGDHGRRYDAVSETVPASLSGNENTAISLSGHSRCRIVRTPTDTLTTTLTVSDGTITVGTPERRDHRRGTTAAAR